MNQAQQEQYEKHVFAQWKQWGDSEKCQLSRTSMEGLVQCAGPRLEYHHRCQM